MEIEAKQNPVRTVRNKAVNIPMEFLLLQIGWQIVQFQCRTILEVRQSKK